MNYKRVLFLDFDGVLHPEGRDDLGLAFLLLGIVNTHDVKLVFSTNWRLSMDLKTLTKQLPLPLQPFVVGMTPEYPAEKGCRQWEVEAWLQDHQVEHFAVLDDNSWLFEEDFDKLVLCNPVKGLTGQDLKKVKKLLAID